MRELRMLGWAVAVTLAVMANFALLSISTEAADKKIKIGVIYDYTGPLAGGGSDLQALGAKIMIDHINAQGGVEGYTIEPIYADAQSKPEIAINEAVRLIEQEKVDMLLGFYSSAQCVPVAAKVDALQKFMWITTCISPAVLKDRNLKYVFRPQVHGGMFGALSVEFLNANAQEKMGVDPKKLRLAIIHEDGPYGSGVAAGNEAKAKELGMNVVIKEGYSATAPTCHRSSPNLSENVPTSSYTQATTPTSRCSCARLRNKVCVSRPSLVMAPATALPTSFMTRWAMMSTISTMSTPYRSGCLIRNR